MKKSQWQFVRIIVGAVLLAGILALHYAVEARWAEITVLCASVAAWLVVGYDVLIKAVMRIVRGQFLDESFLMTLASAGAFAIGEYPEAVAVILFYQVGEYCEKKAVARSRKSIKALLSINPDVATVVTNEGEAETPCEEVRVGDIIMVKPGERVPLDGVVVEGEADMDMSGLNGESMPRAVSAGGEVYSGAVNLNGVLRIRVNKVYGESTASRMIAMVTEARERKAPVENFITSFAKWYTPTVVGIAVVVAVVVPLCVRYNDWATWQFWLKKAMVFLVVSCPCALVISIPLSYFGAIGLAGRMGILIKGGHIFRAVCSLDAVAMDKTGTMTEGRCSVISVYPEDRREAVLSAAYTAEHDSNHPLARAITETCERDGVIYRPADTMREVRGKGVICERDGSAIAAGNASLMAELGVAVPPIQDRGSVIYVANGSELYGYIVTADRIKADTADALAAMRADGLKTVMLSGDAESVAQQVAEEAGVDEYHAECLPQDKVAAVVTLMNAGNVAFVGDGINDAPVIATADVGVAMGGIGSDAAIEVADVVLMHDSLLGIVKLRKIARKTQRIATENIIFALGVKCLVMALGFTAVAESAAMLWLAVAADVGVSVAAILNAMRTGRIGK